MSKYFYLGGSGTWGASWGREDFLIPMGIEFLIKGSHLNYVSNLFKESIKIIRK